MDEDDLRAALRSPLERALERACGEPRVRALWAAAKVAHPNDRIEATRELIARISVEPVLREGLVKILADSFEADLGVSGEPEH